MAIVDRFPATSERNRSCDGLVPARIATTSTVILNMRLNGAVTRYGTSRHVGWLATVAATAFVVAISGASTVLSPLGISSLAETAIVGAVAFVCAGAFSWFMISMLNATNARLNRQNRELTSLHDASVAINLNPEVETVLQRVADSARAVTRSRYAALMVTGEGAPGGRFITSGLSAEKIARIGAQPTGRGLLGLALKDHRPVVVEDIQAHPASVGFPKHHPPIKRLLIVPISIGENIYGQIYVADRLDGELFDDEDRLIAERFSTVAALAIKNAGQLAQIEALAIAAERNRVAREMHDDIAQTLGFINTKSQAAAEVLNAGDARYARQSLLEIGKAARSAFLDVREQISTLRETDLDGGVANAIESTARAWSAQSKVPVTVTLVTPIPTIPQAAGLQILRIVQEALINVRKHANASEVTITFNRVSQNALTIDIDDNGRGFDANIMSVDELPRFGVSIMRERARSFGGTVELCSSEQHGTRVRIHVPVKTTES